MKYPRVIYLGGTPMVGKSTVARHMASRLRYQCLSTDDVGEGIRAATNPSTHPHFHYMGTQDYRDYYATTGVQDLVRDAEAQHAALWPALQTLFENHATWGNPIVIEGWALRPKYVSQLSGDIDGVFLLADDTLIERRARSCGFSSGARDLKAMLSHYIGRSKLYNVELRAHVAQRDLKAVNVVEGMSPHEITKECMRMLRKRGPP